MPLVHPLSFSRHCVAFGSWTDSEIVVQIDPYEAVAPPVVYEVVFVDLQIRGAADHR